MTRLTNDALSIGNSCYDIVLPGPSATGNEKRSETIIARSVGGGAVTAAILCAKLGNVCDLLTTVGEDEFGPIVQKRIERYGIRLHSRMVRETSVSVFKPYAHERAMDGYRDVDFLQEFPRLEIDGCRALHLAGPQEDAALYYAKLCRQKGILTSLDGGKKRGNTDELLRHIQVAIVSRKMCEEYGYDKPAGMLAYLQWKGCMIGGGTWDEHGLFWDDQNGRNQHTPPFFLPREMGIDTTGAGDIFHGG